MKAKALLQKAMRAHEDGFSLLELLVAVAILSIAAVTLLESQAGAVRLTRAVGEQTLASIVAENRLALATAGEDVPFPGIRAGSELQYGQQFAWREQVRVAPGNDIMVIEVTVETADGATAAQLTGYRRAK